MSKFTKIVAVLFIIAMVFGCASSKSSKSTSTDVKSQTGEWPSGSIHI